MKESGAATSVNPGSVRCLGSSTSIQDREAKASSGFYSKLGNEHTYLRAIWDTTPQSIQLLDRNGRLLETNPAGVAMFEADSLQQVIGQDFCRLMNEKYRSQFAELILRTFDGEGGHMQFEMAGLKGGRRWLESAIAPLRFEGKIQACLTITRDVSKEQKMLCALQASERRYRALVKGSPSLICTYQKHGQLCRQLIKVQEEERRKLARELHDGSGQTLVTLLLRLRKVCRSTSLEQARAEAEEMRELVASTIDDLNRISKGLNPSILEDLGLVPALRWMAGECARASSIRTDVLIDEEGWPRLPLPLEITIYRLVQEALNNVTKHAQAHAATILVRRNGKEIEVTVSDDGKGFDVEAQWSRVMESNRLGLLSMRERVTLMGGQMKLESAVEEGTSITCTFPLSGQET